MSMIPGPSISQLYREGFYQNLEEKPKLFGRETRASDLPLKEVFLAKIEP